MIIKIKIILYEGMAEENSAVQEYYKRLRNNI